MSSIVRLINGKMKPQKVKKLRGFLCKSINDRFFFRTYSEDGTYTDYKICHSDLEIQILDSDAYIYKKKGNFCIDHSPKTLGIEKVESSDKRYL